MSGDAGTRTAHDMDMTRRVHHPDVVRTISGRYLNVFEPDVDDIDLGDIAHGLSMVCRYGGHVAAHYSVGEHSLNVAAQLDRMYGEHTLEALIHAKFGTTEAAADPRVKQIDDEILPWEMAMVRDSAVRVAPTTTAVRDAFLERFDSYAFSQGYVTGIDMVQYKAPASRLWSTTP